MSAGTVAQVRGSGVLLLGRVFAMVASGAVQVVLVRTLTKGDFGDFALALTIAQMVQRVVNMGHGQATSRFLSIYEAKGDRGHFLGTLVLVASLVLTGATLILGVGLLIRDPLAGWLTQGDDGTITLVLLLVFYGASGALDELLGNAFAVCSRPAAIFWRKYVLGPLLRLTVTLTVFFTSAGVTALTLGFLGAGVGGVLIYVWLLRRALADHEGLRALRLSETRLPFRQLFSFGWPLISTEILNLCVTGVGVVLLGARAGDEAVADLRAVVPLAALNQMVLFTFTTLYIPLATRLTVGEDRPALVAAYWQTAGWLAILSFPIIALTGPLAEPVTVGLLGEQYAGSALVLVLLSLGFYVNACFGYNVATLIALGRVRYLMWVNLGGALFCVTGNLLLIPQFGAVGVAITTLATMSLQNLLAQVALTRHLRSRLVDRSHAYVLLSAICALLLLWAVASAVDPGLVTAVVLAAVTSVLLLLVNRHRLQLGTAFPEVARVPVLGRIF